MSEQKQTLYMIGNSHIDPVWLWRDREGLQEARATFASALDRMDEFDEFVFSASSAALYAWVEAHHPSLFARIRERVAEGRWQIVGGWWVEPDMNIPGGESMVRQGLYGQRYFQRAFGIKARTAFNVDSFGHSKGTARILAQQGISRYVFMRPNPSQWQLSTSLFTWQDADGTAITGCQIQGEYCAWTKTAILKNLDKSLEAMQANGLASYPVYYGVGNHGGGPTIENIKAIRELAQERTQLHFIHSGPDAFFDSIDADTLPVYTGELEGIFPGCYTSDSGLKSMCRTCEEALVHAETISIMAGHLGFAYPKHQLDEAWRLLLFSQFHDTMAGTARKEARDDASLDMARCLCIAREAAGGAIQAISAGIDTRGDGHALLLVNTTDVDYHGIVEADIYWREKHPMRLKAANGLEIPYDNTLFRRVAPDTRKRLVFYADIPAFGYAVYRMLPEAAQITMPPPLAKENVLENDQLRLTFDPAARALASVWDKRQEKELLAAPITLDVYEDMRDTWGVTNEITKRLGQYLPEEMFLLENGGIRSTMCIRLRYGHSEALLRFSLGREDAFFTLDGSLDNREKHTLTSLRIPYAAAYECIHAEMPYAEITRAYTEPGERHCQRYTDLIGAESGMLLINRAKYAYRVHEGAYEAILARSPIHAFSSGEAPEKGRLYDYIDMGVLPFTLQFHPHDGKTSRAERIRRAQQLHRTPEALADSIHTGKHTLRAQSFLYAEGLDGCIIHLMKAGEDGGTVLRIESTIATACEGVIYWQNTAYPVAVSPLSLVTLCLGADGNATAMNLLEET